MELHRHAQQLEEALKSKMDDLEKARVLFRQIVHLLPQGNWPPEIARVIIIDIIDGRGET